MTSVVVTQTTIDASVLQESVSVSVTSTPINVTISPVDINSHSSVTIGTANGLSLSGQVLSLGLSSALATGALSSADWSTFNGKLSDAPSDGTTYGRLNGAWSAVVSSVAWGGITGTLSNQTDLQAALDAKVPIARTISTTTPLSGGGDLSANRTIAIALADTSTSGYLSSTDWNTFNNKQAALSFPLASTSGGTGVNNSGTITNASNTTITGGGTIALGTFTLTVPATGTAALLAVAQTISATKTFTAAQIIDLSADAIGLTIQGHSTQTNDLLLLENSTGTDLLTVDGLGNIAQVATSTDHTVGSHNQYTFTLTAGTNLTPGTVYAYDNLISLISNANITGTKTFVGSRFLVTWDDPAANKVDGTIIGGRFHYQNNVGSALTLATGIGGEFQVTSSASRSGWITTAAIAARFNVSLQSSSAHTTTSAISLLATTHIKNANITITTAYGLKVESMTVGATNYAIFTELGLVNFGDVVNTTASYQVDGTQVITNRVIDARCDDAISSGDATTDGVIDALRDAMITHGLIAAA